MRWILHETKWRVDTTQALHYTNRMKQRDPAALGNSGIVEVA